jgi:hypothetical protein
VALFALIGAIVFALLMLGSKPVSAAGDTSLPASKATIAIDKLVGLTQAASAPGTNGGPNTTGWKKVLSTQIKTANQKDLMFDASFQCGIVTDTTVSSTNGGKSTSQARGTIAVRVLVDGVPAQPDSGIDATGDPYGDGGIVYCDRIQTLSAQFSGLGCTASATGEVTCTQPETLQLILETLNANSFNFAMKDVSSGVHTVTVEAKADAAAKLIDDASGGTLAGAEAFVGAGSLFVEEVRLINKDVAGVNPIELQ